MNRASADRLPGVVAFLTDFGWQDDYVGQMHAASLSVDRSLRTIDLVHDVPPGDIRAAAFLLRSTLKHLPESSASACVVDPGVGTRREIVLLKSAGKWLVAPDNGLLSPIVDSFGVERLLKLTAAPWLHGEQTSRTFHGRDLMAPAAAWLASGRDPGEIGQSYSKLHVHVNVNPEHEGDDWIAEIMWVDRYGNLITNFPAKSVDHVTVELGGKRIHRVETFAEASPDVPVWLTGSRETVEIVVNGGSAAQLLASDRGDRVRVSVSSVM
jgi:S-adenosylmethionine hydrolase